MMLIMKIHLIHKKIETFVLNKSIICHYSFLKVSLLVLLNIYFFSVFLGSDCTAYFLTFSKVFFFPQVYFGPSIVKLLYYSLKMDSKKYYFQQNFVQLSLTVISFRDSVISK